MFLLQRLLKKKFFVREGKEVELLKSVSCTEEGQEELGS